MPEAEKSGASEERKPKPDLPVPEPARPPDSPPARKKTEQPRPSRLSRAKPWLPLAGVVLLTGTFLALAIRAHREAERLRSELRQDTEEVQFLQQETARLKSVADRLKKESESRHSRLKATEEILSKAEEIELAREQRDLAEGRRRERLERLKEQITGDLGATVSKEKLTVLLEGETLVLRLSGKGIFENVATLTSAGKETLKTLADLFNTQLKDHPILIEAHSDQVPIGEYLKDRFPSNTALSAFRAAVITDFLASTGGVVSTRLSACGRGEAFPLDPGTGAEADDKNRRIEFRIDTSSANPKAQKAAPAGPAPEKQPQEEKP